MEFQNIREKNIVIEGIPALVHRPKENLKNYPTIIFYHGWGSNPQSQRFRAFILSSLGYQVIVPCAIYHGDRNPIDHGDKENSSKYFWEVVLKNIEESDSLIDYAIKELGADSNRMGICGHSMGGFTSGGIFAKNNKLKSLIVFNGSCNWDYFNKMVLQAFDNPELSIEAKLQDKLDEFNPMKNQEKIINRPILLLHGDSDSLVDINGQREFYKILAAKYIDSEKLRLIEAPRLNHYITTNMMEEAGRWFNKYI